MEYAHATKAESIDRWLHHQAQADPQTKGDE